MATGPVMASFIFSSACALLYCGFFRYSWTAFPKHKKNPAKMSITIHKSRFAMALGAGRYWQGACRGSYSLAKRLPWPNPSRLHQVGYGLNTGQMLSRYTTKPNIKDDSPNVLDEVSKSEKNDSIYAGCKSGRRGFRKFLTKAAMEWTRASASKEYYNWCSI
ncbi:hypothetical protein V8C34DRAFT_294916 [Trichoderma compactum]